MRRLHKPKAGFWFRLCVSVICPLDGLLFRLRWRHLDRIPPPAPEGAGSGRDATDRPGGVIIAVNHISHIDTLLVARLLWQSGRLPRFMIKATLFHTPLLSAIFRYTGQIPVYRGTTNAARSLQRAADALRGGQAVVIYPEGTITSDPGQWPMQGRTGIARLVLMCPEIPVVPIGQWGVQQRNGRSRLTLLRRRTSLAAVGHPVELSAFRDATAGADVLRKITDTIMSAIRDEVAALRGEQPPEHFHVPRRRYVDTV